VRAPEFNPIFGRVLLTNLYESTVNIDLHSMFDRVLTSAQGMLSIIMNMK